LQTGEPPPGGYFGGGSGSQHEPGGEPTGVTLSTRVGIRRSQSCCPKKHRRARNTMSRRLSSSWAPEIPSNPMIADVAPGNCELVHTGVHFPKLARRGGLEGLAHRNNVHAKVGNDEGQHDPDQAEYSHDTKIGQAFGLASGDSLNESGHRCSPCWPRGVGSGLCDAHKARRAAFQRDCAGGEKLFRRAAFLFPGEPPGARIAGIARQAMTPACQMPGRWLWISGRAPFARLVRHPQREESAENTGCRPHPRALRSALTRPSAARSSCSCASSPPSRDRGRPAGSARSADRCRNSAPAGSRCRR
jgi:hypothetical protein